MDAPEELKEVLAEGRAVRALEEGIYSVMPDAGAVHHYDRRAAVYDSVVGTRLYNFVMWGSSPRDYVAFARAAVESRADGPLLDAACGSMLFTARLYLETRRTVVAFDQSLSMLRRARRRLDGAGAAAPANVLLLQADLSDLPFRPAAFATLLCMNVLHHYEDAAALIPRLKGLLAEGGGLYLTSLVSNRRFVGDRYLKALHASGEFVRPRSGGELRAMLREALGQGVTCRIKGNMAYASASGLGR